VNRTAGSPGAVSTSIIMILSASHGYRFGFHALHVNGLVVKLAPDVAEEDLVQLLTHLGRGVDHAGARERSVQRSAQWAWRGRMVLPATGYVRNAQTDWRVCENPKTGAPWDHGFLRRSLHLDYDPVAARTREHAGASRRANTELSTTRRRGPVLAPRFSQGMRVNSPIPSMSLRSSIRARFVSATTAASDLASRWVTSDIDIPSRKRNWRTSR
jgi:hypothetical protein